MWMAAVRTPVAVGLKLTLKVVKFPGARLGSVNAVMTNWRSNLLYRFTRQDIIEGHGRWHEPWVSS